MATSPSRSCACPTIRMLRENARRAARLLVWLCCAGAVAAQSASGPAAEGLPPVHGWTPERDVWSRMPRSVEPALRIPAVPPGEFAQRRVALAAALGGPCAVWIPARAFEELDPFFQSDDFYYLSGVEVPDIALLLVIGADGSLADECLFLPPEDPRFELWNGDRLAPGPESAAATGFRRTAALPGSSGEAPADWPAALAAVDVPRVCVLEAPDWSLPEGRQLDVADEHDSGGLRGRLSALRLRKSTYEIECLTAAIDVTCAGLRNALTEVRPGAFEFAPQGALEGTFLRLGAERPGFASIFGSGPNSVTLHYNSNRRRMEEGDLLVMDVGAKLRYYCADVTRTVPVNGRYSERQREVYNLVLAAQTAAAEAARPGVTIKDLDDVARKVIEDAGYERRHFPHSVGHWIGLDVHDVGGKVPIEEGCLFTIEPGIYIAEEHLGVRIEDDYLMTATGAVKLSVGMPSDPEAIEALMAGIE